MGAATVDYFVKCHSIKRLEFHQPSYSLTTSYCDDNQIALGINKKPMNSHTSRQWNEVLYPSKPSQH
jgi:hypothetical protein